MTPTDRSHTSSYWHSIVTKALSCTVFIKARYWLKIVIFHTIPAFDAVRGVPIGILP